MLRVKFTQGLIFLTILISCNQAESPVVVHSSIKPDSLTNAKHYQLEMLEHALTCGCSPIYEIFPWEADLYCMQGVSGKDSIEFESEFKACAHDSIRNTVKFIGFIGYNSIPTRFRIFKNVEKIYISGIGYGNNKKVNLKGLEIFPKLKRIEFWGCDVNIDSNDSWIHQIEEIAMYKCRITDFPSFDRWNNLKILRMGHSGFDPFPRNMNSLNCLQKIMVSEYRSKKSGPLNLRQLDFRYFPCLRFASFHGGTTGIPKRLDNKRYYRLDMRKWGLSDDDRKKIDPYLQHFN